MWFISKFGLLFMVLSSGIIPKVTGDNPQAQAMVVLGTWSTFSSLRNMRCICNHAISSITSTFYVNISLTSPALFHGAWIAKHVQSATTNMWHLLKNSWYSYPPEIDLWFDLRYESNDPEPTGVCSWNFSEASHQSTVATNNIDGIDTDIQPSVSFPPPSTDGFTSSTTQSYNNDSESRPKTETDPPTTKSSTPEVTKPVDTIASCLCPCSCVKKTQEEIDAMIREIIGDLRIDENATALARRRLSSASDTRWVSRGIGWVGVIIMTVVFGSIALADYKRFLNSFHMLLKNISGQH